MQNAPELIEIDQAQLRDLGERVRNSIGFEIEWLLEFMSMNFYVFEANYHDLDVYLEKMTHPREWFTDILPIIKEVLRLFHNYLASAKTLIDLTRAAVQAHLVNAVVRHEYDRRVTVLFGNDPLSGFLQDLRNFLLHRQLPLVMPKPQLGVDTDGEILSFSMALAIRRDQLLGWNNWSARSREYLSHCDEEIELGPLVDGYYSAVSSFHSWLHLAIREEFEDELQQLAEMQDELHALMVPKGEVAK
jgi:hypothetical protein